jgi:hypothetical protein
MRPIVLSFFIMTGLSCAQATNPSSSRVAAASVPESWRSCAVARSLARQSTRGLSLLAELESYLVGDAIAFRVCGRGDLDCNGPTQPFPGRCKDHFFSQRLSKAIETSWSSGPRPEERSASYAVVFIHQQANQIVAELDLRYRFTGNPPGAMNGPHLWAGVTETSEDAPAIRVAIPKDNPTTTRESAIALGEREIDRAAEDGLAPATK